MKYKFFLLILLLLNSCGGGPDIPCISDKFSDHVLAFYPFSNQSLNDLSGNNPSLLNVGSVKSVSDRNGNTNCAFRFNGDSSQYLTRNGSFLNGIKSKSFSISMWYRPLDGENSRQFLFIKGEAGKTNCDVDSKEEWFIGLHDCERLSFTINKKVRIENFPLLWQDNSIKQKCKEEINLYNDKWHHIVFTYDNTNLNIYRNGKKSERDTQNTSCGSLLDDQGNLYLGRYYIGDIDDLIIFDKVLNQSDVDALYSTLGCCL